MQYGSDAIGGVINIRTKKATQPVGATLMGQYGRFNTVTAFAAPEFHSADGKFGGYLSGGVSKSDGVDYTQNTPATNGDPNFSTKTVSGNFAYAISNSAKLSLYTHYTDDDRVSRGGLAEPVRQLSSQIYQASQGPIAFHLRTSQRFELEAGARPVDWLYFEMGYMNLDATNDNTGQYLFNRSRHALKTRMNVKYEG